METAATVEAEETRKLLFDMDIHKDAYVCDAFGIEDALDATPGELMAAAEAAWDDFECELQNIEEALVGRGAATDAHGRPAVAVQGTFGTWMGGQPAACAGWGVRETLYKLTGETYGGPERIYADGEKAVVWCPEHDSISGSSFEIRGITDEGLDWLDRECAELPKYRGVDPSDAHEVFEKHGVEPDMAGFYGIE